MEHDAQELPLGERVEVESGVTVERRCFLKTAAVAFGVVAVPGRPELRIGASESAALTLEEFLVEAVPVAKALVEDPTLAGQDRYLLTLAAYAVRLEGVPVPELRPTSQDGGVSIGLNGAPGPFVILHWKMEPGSEVRSHAHTYGNVVTFGLEGAARVENFEVLGVPDYDSAEPFQVRRTISQWLTPGGTNLVNLQRNYVHGFKAGRDGARGLDITTRILEKRATPYLELGEAAGDQDGVFTGIWTD
ncbi:MAG: hypothetical protein ACI8QZ_002438 [Chlamydiales bacterium]|jgi:hypothetical protein